MANYKTCRTCGAPLHDDDIAIYRKLVYRGAEDFCAYSALRIISSARKRKLKSASAITAKAACARCSADSIP